VVENSIAFRGIAHSTLTFTHNLDIPLAVDGLVVVTFFLPPIVYNNPLTNLFHMQYDVKLLLEVYCIFSIRKKYV